MITRERVWQLLRVPDPATIAPEAVQVGGAELWRTVNRSRVTLIGGGGRPVPCWWLTPVTDGPWPAAVAIHQHNGEFHLGKSEPAGMSGDPHIAYGLELPQRGVATLIPDLSGFEERRRPGLDDTRGEQLAAWDLVARGRTLLGMHVEDIAMAVSWLTQQGAVTGRVGVVGHSLGAQVGLYAMACDARIRAGVLSCGVGTVRSTTAADILHNPAWYPPGIVELGDVPVVASVLSEQRVLVAAGRQDPIFPLAGAVEVVDSFRQDVVDFRPFDGVHEFTDELRASALEWLQGILRTPETPLPHP